MKAINEIILWMKKRSSTSAQLATEAEKEISALVSERDALKEAIKNARIQLQSTQINWQEDCLFECNDILTAALDVCPSCTWRGDVPLQDGVCPYCKTNWNKIRGEE